ncbi:MAG: hypothetical protein NZ730_10565 [Porticoccaceae bacterium]|nr:hypothetical protein [Porticoccaceae bacterium]
MFFEIDADLVYARPRMTKADGRAVIIEENIAVAPTKKWKRIFISSNLIAAMQDKLTELDDLFDINRFGHMFAASAFETYKDIDDRDEPHVKLMINTEFKALGTEEHARSLWNSQEFIDSWRNAFESFEDYFQQYTNTRFGIIADEWFEDDQGKAITHSTEKYRALGSYHEDNWYEEAFRIAGFKNIRAIKLFNPDTGRRNKATIETVVKKAVSDLQEAAYQVGETLEEYYDSIDIDSFADWHNGRIRYFQQKYGHKSALHQYLIIKTMDYAHPLRKIKKLWDTIRPFAEGVLIGTGAMLVINFISKLFN